MKRVFGKYKVHTCLNEYEFGGSYCARTDGKTEQYLLHSVSRSVVSDGWLLRLKHEMDVLGNLKCETYNSPVDLLEADGMVVGVYHWVDGEPLGRLIRNDSWCNENDKTRTILEIAESMLEALQSIHQQSCVHRDIRPSHIIRTNDGKYILGGYGPLCIADAFSTSGYESYEFATYASPELAGLIECSLSPSSDLYSLGVVIYQLLTGRPPFVGQDMTEVLFEHLTSTPDFQGISASVQPELIQLTERLLAKEPKNRYQSASSVIADFREIGMLVDGKIDTVVLGRHDERTELAEPSFVGRKRELAEVEAAICQAKNGGNAAVVLCARSGMGKSRLIVEAARIAQRQGLDVYRSIASNQATQAPLGPLLSIVDQFAGRLESNQELREQAGEQLAEFRAEIATAMPTLALALGWTNASLGGPQECGQERIVRAFCRVLATCSLAGPAMICVDDCQWLGRPSLRVLEAFSSADHDGICLFLGSRPDEEDAQEQLPPFIQNAKTVVLNPLSSEESNGLIESMAGLLPAGVLEIIRTMAAGSPFMTAAAIRGLVESKALVSDRSGWVVNHERLSQFQASSDSASLLLKRLDFVEPLALRLMSIGAVAGKQFELSVTSRLTNVASEQAIKAFASASEQNLVWIKPGGGIAFVHDKIRESVLERLGEREKRAFHQAIAENIEHHSPESVFDLAHHYDQAKIPEKAWRPALQAAQTARQSYALDNAETLFRIAAQAIPLPSSESDMQLGSQYEVESGLFDVLMLLGKYDEAETWLNAAIKSAREPAEVARMMMHYGDIAYRRGNKQQACENFEEALSDAGYRLPKSKLQLGWGIAKELAVQAAHSAFPKRFVSNRTDAPSDKDRMAWTLHSKLAHSYWHVRDKYHTLWAHLRGMNLAERYGQSAELAEAYAEHAPALSLVPWFTRGLDYAQRSLEIRQQLGDVWGEGQSRNFMSIVLYSSSQYDTCLEQATNAFTVLERTGDYREMHVAKFQAVGSLFRMGRLREACDGAQQLYHSAIETGDYQASANSLGLWVRSSLGQVPAEIIETELERTPRDHQSDCHVWLAEGVQHFYANRIDAAIASFRRSIDSITKTRVRNAYTTPNYAWYATALRARIDQTTFMSPTIRKKMLVEHFKAAKKACRVAKKFKNDLPHSLRELAIAYALRGNCSKARKYLRNSVRVADQQGAVYEKAISEHTLAKLEAEIQPTAENIAHQRSAKKVVDHLVGCIRLDDNNSLSLIDRFECVLASEREINAATTSESIMSTTADAAKRLLRAERIVLVQRSQRPDGGIELNCVEPLVGDFDHQLVENAHTTNDTVTANIENCVNHGVDTATTGTFLCCPIGNGEADFFLYVANTYVSALFGDDEIKIANYLASTMAAALQRREGVEKLVYLNSSLEQHVADRTQDLMQRTRELQNTANMLMQTQAELEKAKTVAENANQSKSEFLACMSHEIRTPMTAVLGFAEILMTEDLELSEQHEFIHRIQSNGQHLLSLINDILDFSKIEAGKMDFETISCLAHDLVVDAVTALESRAREKCIELNVQIDGQIPEFIQTDPTRLRQIVTNLVGNAIKFTSEGGVNVALRLDELGDTPELMIEIADTGVGIDPHEFDRVFESFAQADASTTREYGGSGLGLAITKRLVQAMGGHMSLASQRDYGSTFTVQLPVGDITNVKLIDQSRKGRARDRNFQKQGQQNRLANRHILVVDDVEANRDLIGFLLSKEGASLTYAVNGKEALDIVTEMGVDNFDLILMDMQMPIMDGLCATKRLREMQFKNPIVALTANNTKQEYDRCLAEGCNEFLGKPIDIGVLLDTAAELTSESSKNLAAATSRVPAQAPVSTAQTTADAGSESQPDEFGTEEVMPDQEYLDLIKQLRLEFLSELAKRLPALEAAANKQNASFIMSTTHWIRGTGGSVGYDQHVKTAQEIEAHVRNKDFKAALRSIEMLS